MSFKHFVARHFQGSKYDWMGISLLLGISFGLSWWTDFGVDDIFFWVFAVWIFWWNRDARISIGAALGGLILIPGLLALESRDIAVWNDGSAETVAVWVYFFLVIGVAKQLWDMRR